MGRGSVGIMTLPKTNLAAVEKNGLGETLSYVLNNILSLEETTAGIETVLGIESDIVGTPAPNGGIIHVVNDALTRLQRVNERLSLVKQAL